MERNDAARVSAQPQRRNLSNPFAATAKIRHRIITEGGRLWVMTPIRPRPQRASIQTQMTAIPGSRPVAVAGFAGCGSALCGSVITLGLKAALWGSRLHFRAQGCT